MNLKRIDRGDAMLNEAPWPSNRNTFAVIAGSPESPAAVSSQLVIGIANGLYVAEGRRIQVQRTSPKETKLVDVRFKHPIGVS